VVLGIPDHAQGQPMSALSYSIDSDPSTAPVTLTLGHAYSIDIAATGVSRFDVTLEFNDSGKAAFGGTKGLSAD
jgi:hypothetical protein